MAADTPEATRDETQRIQEAAAFGATFIPAIVKLRKAYDAGSGADLTADEVRGVVDAFRLLKRGGDDV